MQDICNGKKTHYRNHVNRSFSEAMGHYSYVLMPSMLHVHDVITMNRYTFRFQMLLLQGIKIDN